jgi:predicted transcriptional regulator
MARQSASLISTRVDETLKQQFVRSAEFNHQSPSEALRQAIQTYVRDARKAALERDSAAIRANGEDEADVLNWIAAHSAADDGS